MHVGGLQQVINALSTGGVYALIALGYTLVFGVLRLINFAHCDVMMVGAYVGYIAAAWLHLPLLPALVLSMGICALLGVILERFAYRPVRQSPGIAALVVAIGASLLIEYTIMLAFGASPKAVNFNELNGVMNLFGASIPVSRLFMLAVSILLMLALQGILTHTKSGRAMRAMACDSEAAKLCGVNLNATTMLAFALGSALAGTCGVLYGSMFAINPLMGVSPGLKAFVAAVVGGIGSIPGAVLGGLALGLCETFAAVFISTSFKDAAAFVMLIGVLLIRPGGITNSQWVDRA